MEEKGHMANRNQLRSGWLYLEERRPMIVRTLVYDGSSVKTTADLFGVLRSRLMGVLRSWEVHIPESTSSIQHRIWFRRKTETGNRLPRPLYRINRSDLLSMWRNWDMEALCTIWGVGEATLESALEFHCIVPSHVGSKAPVFLSGSLPRQNRDLPLENSDRKAKNPFGWKQRKYLPERFWTPGMPLYSYILSR